MKGRSFAIVSWCALSMWLLAGCAGNQMLSDRLTSSNRPQLLIPGAIRSDVKGLAMGSARARGWTIVKSTDDLLVMQHPLDPSSPSTLALGTIKSAVPPVIEVTSAFVEQSGGVNVALDATLITQPPDEKSPKRADYTEHYREALTQSLESLRSNWTANRQRVANAMPTPTPPAPTPTPPASGQDQTATTGPAAPQFNPAPPIQPLQSTSSPAPVVDGSGRGSATAPTERATPPQPQPTPEPVAIAPQDNMLALNQASGTGIWAYYAEQYARLHGCNLTDAGAQLIENRADGEIHKVSCVGSDSYLLQCQDGVCRKVD